MKNKIKLINHCTYGDKCKNEWVLIKGDVYGAMKKIIHTHVYQIATFQIKK